VPTRPDPSADPVLPYGVATSRQWDGHRVVARYGESVVVLQVLADAGLLPREPWWTEPTLNSFMAAGPTAWAVVRRAVEEAVADLGSEDVPRRDRVDPAQVHGDFVELVLPFEVADYVDFYANEHHATNLGRILRPGQEPLAANWRHLPTGYHGRAGTVVVSGTPVVRPSGQRRPDPAQPPTFGPSERLDVEVELGFVVGVGSAQGEPVAIDDFAEHVFGVVLVNDWSARDIQAWEFAPLGPFLGKSFATSVSPWVVPLAALEPARRPVASADAELLPYLRESAPWGLDISFELSVNGEVLSRPPYASMYWSPAQMLAHLTSNGASLRTGDLYASGTVSGPSMNQVGSLIERFENAQFLADGDEVVISATAAAGDAGRLDLGAVRGRVLASSQTVTGL
jgi:fumarylacetoacetase